MKESYQSLLGRRFHHWSELNASPAHLLPGGAVGSSIRSLPPCHHCEGDGGDDGDECQEADDGSDDVDEVDAAGCREQRRLAARALEAFLAGTVPGQTLPHSNALHAPTAADTLVEAGRGRRRRQGVLGPRGVHLRGEGGRGWGVVEAARLLRCVDATGIRMSAAGSHVASGACALE